tara:strand:- start:330 stop:713 length:384 start_codon:yes stop_codon:yes gene_type:complete
MNKGFTLIELMITMCIIGVLAAIVIPTYGGYVQKARRSDGQAELMRFSGELERCYTISFTYNDDNCMVYKQLKRGIGSRDKYYAMKGVINEQKYELTATAQNGQESDEECKVMTYNSLSESKPDKCW